MHIIARKRLNEFAENIRRQIHCNRRKVYIRAVLTHTDYDAGKWKER